MAYSQDLRERVVAAVEADTMSNREIAGVYGIGEATVERWMARKHATGSVAALPAAGGRPRTLAPYAATLRAEVKRQPDISLSELCERVQAQTGAKSGTSMMCRELKLLNLPLKKKSLYDSQRDTRRVKRLRQAYEEYIDTELARLPKRLKFIDESGVHTGLTRGYGRARPGQRVTEGTPGHSGTHYTFLASLSLTGIEAPLLFEGALNGDIFETYVHDLLGPCLKRNDIVIMDNLAAHKQVRIREAIEARGARVVFLPPYSPDLNPIELCWSKIKAWLRQAKARTWEALVDALAEALRAVTSEDILAWFTHCGYAIT